MRHKKVGLVFCSCAIAGLSCTFSRSAQAETPYEIGWSRQIGTSEDDSGARAAVDGFGNIYVSGSTEGDLAGPSAGSSDAFLTKYDGLGNLLWSSQYGSDDGDYAYSVAVDPAGNAYTSGATSGSLGAPFAGFYDAFLTKSDADGNVEWSRQIGTSGLDIGHSVAADSFGNAYISGETSGSLFAPSAGGDDVFLTKYDASGNVLWSHQFGTSGNDVSYSVNVDNLANVYVTGFTSGNLAGPSAGSGDAFLRKYDSTGNILWTRQLGSANGDSAWSVTTDNLGNAFISGHTTGSLGGPSAGNEDAFIAKYDPAGTFLWSRQLGTAGTDVSYGVAADTLGNAYISGYTQLGLVGPSAGARDAYLAKFDPAGNFLWGHQVGTEDEEFGYSVAVDNLDNAYVSGSTGGSLGGPNAGGDDAFLVRFFPPEVPEPGTLTLLALGSVGLLVGHRSKRNRRRGA